MNNQDPRPARVGPGLLTPTNLVNSSMNIVLARLGGKGACPLVTDLVIKVFQYWQKVTSVKGFPAEDVNSWGTSRPVPWVISLCPSLIWASKSLVNGPSGSW